MWEYIRLQLRGQGCHDELWVHRHTPVTRSRCGIIFLEEHPDQGTPGSPQRAGAAPDQGTKNLAVLSLEDLGQRCRFSGVRSNFSPVPRPPGV